MRATRSSLPARMCLPGKFSRGNYVTSITGYEVFITIAVTLISNTVPPSGQRVLPCQNDHLYKVLETILSILPAYSLAKREREKRKGKEA